MRAYIAFLIFSAFLFSLAGAAGEEVELWSSSTPSGLKIKIDPKSGEREREIAEPFAEALEKMTGAPVEVTETELDQPGIVFKLNNGPVKALERDNYSLSTSSEQGLVIRGNSEIALQHGAWDLLHRLGYRQYFPGKTWEVIPKLDKLTLELDMKESPAYASRRIWYGYGLWEHNKEAYRDWVMKNRMEGSFTLNTGHAYHGLISSQRETFEAHPEYYALVDGERRINDHSKLCTSNPGVLEAAGKYGLGFFEKHPDADSVSVDPSDGGNWCECKDCETLGPPNERALILANHVAKVVTAKLGNEKFVGMYAYNYHSQPPSIRVHPNVIISAATAFIKEGMKIDDIVSGWSEKGATIGIREYYSVNTWDRDLPGAARGSNLEYLSETIPKFHKAGAKFLSAESSDNWGPNGLGYYFASRLMWDPGEAERRDEIETEFLENCFGPAKEPMRAFYHLLDGSNKRARLVFDDLLARMFTALNEAGKLSKGDVTIQRRIDDLVLYTRHAELYDAYRQANGPARQKAFEEMIRHAYKIRDTFMVHSYALYRDVHNRDKNVALPERASWKVPENENPWKDSSRYTDAEIGKILKDGMTNHEKVELDFAARQYSEKDLVPASEILELPESLSPGGSEVARGKRSWFTLVNEPGEKLTLHITGGMIEHYRDRGNVRVSVFKIGGASETGEDQTLVAEDSSVPPDGQERTVSIRVDEPGVYRIDLDDGADMTKVTWPVGQEMSWKMSLEEYPARITGRWTLYFYVPRGTKSIGLYSAASAGQLVHPDGEVALDLIQGGGNFLSVPVPEAADGKLWKISKAAGSVRLLNVPPFLARSPEELILPSDAGEF